MGRERPEESTNSLNKNIKQSEEAIQELSKRLIHDLNMGRWDYIERRDDYLQEFKGADKFPNKIAHDMIKAWRWDEVFRHIDRFEPTQTLAKALLSDMIKKWFYEDKEERARGWRSDLLEDSVIDWENFLSRFGILDKSTAILVLKLLEKNMFPEGGYTYKEHLGDCFNPKYFTGLDEEILKKLSDRWVVIEDKDKKSFVWIDNTKREKYKKVALEVQKKAKKESEDELKDLQDYLTENYE